MTQTQVNIVIAYHPWLPLTDRGKVVGQYRLRAGTNYFKREFDFMPLTPNNLVDTELGENLVEWFSRHNLSIDSDGAVSVRLGPNVRLERVSKQIARAYNIHSEN